MSNEDSVILSSSTGNNNDNLDQPPRATLKKKLLIIAAIAFFAILIFILVLFVLNKTKGPAAEVNNGLPVKIENQTPSSTNTLPDFSQFETATSTLAASSTLSGVAVEYLAFANFYDAPNNQIVANVLDYKLPLNVKIDVLNYYDVSRKLNLDKSLENLNLNGFAEIDNPWTKEAPDFFSVYSNLNSQQLPLLITTDFIIYSYQNILKEIFKDIEKNIFYDNLWEINSEMFVTARNRYEDRLAAIGDVNDSILEGERLEVAFFATALELLKPSSNQIAKDSAKNKNELFSITESNKFNFVTPPYLKNDVLAEIKLIREAKAINIKSPVRLYSASYQDFIIPSEYQANAKLANFYLTSKWLNSAFPLNYRDKNCSDCLLDKEDWRINFIAANFISQDFAALPELKNKWARIYKIISFFKGLREELNYVNYRDSLIATFGKDYKIAELFSDQNKEAGVNLEKLRNKLLTYEFSDVFGALNPITSKKEIGFKMLAESFWSNDYIFTQLTGARAGNYLGTSTKLITACNDDKTKQLNRCSGFSLDPINLVFPISNNQYFADNTNYKNYELVSGELRNNLVKNNVWHFNSYWANLDLIKAQLSMDKGNLPLFAQMPAWQDKNLNTAAGAWINLQLPLDKPIVIGSDNSASGFASLAKNVDNSYIEPNLDLLNEMIADSNMILRMLSALQLNLEVRSATQSLEDFSRRLAVLKDIVVKELSGQILEEKDGQEIVNFSLRMKTDPKAMSRKKLTIQSTQDKVILNEDLSQLKLLILTHRVGDNNVFSVGPVWSYQESR